MEERAISANNEVGLLSLYVRNLKRRFPAEVKVCNLRIIKIYYENDSPDVLMVNAHKMVNCFYLQDFAGSELNCCSLINFNELYIDDT